MKKLLTPMIVLAAIGVAIRAIIQTKEPKIDLSKKAESVLKSGEKSTNDIRIGFNLRPIPSDLADSKLISKDQCNTHEV